MVLDELQDLRSNNNEKKHYIVEELEFELGVIINNDRNGHIEGGNIFGFKLVAGADWEKSKEDIQKVKIKLKPKNDRISTTKK